MTPLLEKLKSKLAFDDEEYSKVIDENVFFYDVRLVKAAAMENARLKSVHEALVLCVHQLMAYQCDEPCQCGDCEALRALAKAVEHE